MARRPPLAHERTGAGDAENRAALRRGKPDRRYGATNTTTSSLYFVPSEPATVNVNEPRP
jgi:hypothetical protein